MIRQVRLIPSGVQTWHRDTIAATSDAFAYSSTMALHIFRLKDNTLQKMIAAHERAISAICWSPEDSNLLASCSLGSRIAIWDLENEEEKFATKITEVPVLLDWASSGDKIVFATENGNIMVWDYKGQKTSKIFSVAAKGAKVLRWHPSASNRLVCGVEDGSLAIFDHQSGKKVLIVGKSKTSKDPVTDAQWDPLSDTYLLVSFADGSLTLYESGTQAEIHSFEKQTQGIKSIAWAKAQPGNFLTATDRVGVLRLWNVSQRSPLMQIKVGHTGVLCIKAIPSEPNWFLLSFKNSCIGVCDIASRAMRFMTAPGHSETIFDVAFNPTNPDMLATASYDGYLKLWRLSTSESHREMHAGDGQTLYGLAFGPGATRVCAVSSTGFLFIWRVDTGEQVLKLQVHTGQAYRCEWNPQGKGFIATGGADGLSCITDPATGNITHRIVHPHPVYGVHWHPLQEGLLATGCQDGSIRIFNTHQFNGKDMKPFLTLQGHDSRVFNVVFHPMCPNILCSGSDDKSIRIWNCNPAFQGQREIRRLVGHTAYVRGLLWHSELPHILMSGSWDSTIRVWDAVEQKCLHVSHDHHADVYGLSLHAQRPFFLVSSSRDTTIRYWIFEDLVRPLLVHTLLHPERMTELIGDPSEVSAAIEASPGSVTLPRQLYGQVSRALAKELQSIGATRPITMQVYEKVVSFFMYRHGLDDVWGLLAAIRGDQLPVVPGMRRVCFHEKETIACQKSKALELASQRGQIGVAGKREERLLKAAQIMLRVGDVRSFCRFTAQAGHWERAICIAPAVSHQFWQELCAEYMETMSASGNVEEIAPFLVGIGKSSSLVDAYIDRSDLDNAFVVAKANCDGLMPAPCSPKAPAPPPPPPPPPDPLARQRLQDVASVLASRHSSQGEPLQAAMCYLAVSQPSRAVSMLSRSHEIILAYVVAELLGETHSPILLKLLSQCAERDARLEVAAELLQKHPLGTRIHLPLLARRTNKTQIWPLQTEEQYSQDITSALAAGDKVQAVLAAVCARQDEYAVRLGVEALCELFGSPGGWSLADARLLLEPLESVPLQDLGVKEIASTLACAAYVGLVEASTLGYHELMFPLAQTLRNIITHQNLNFPVSVQEISLLEATGISHRSSAKAVIQINGLLNDLSLPDHLRAACQQQLAAISQRAASDEWPLGDGPGFAKMAGGQLPASYKRYAKVSVLTNQLIKGPSFELEDRKMHVSLSDAMSWARVNAFSPLNTGCRIHPL